MKAADDPTPLSDLIQVGDDYGPYTWLSGHKRSLEEPNFTTFKWFNTVLGDIKTAIRGTYHKLDHVRAKNAKKEKERHRETQHFQWEVGQLTMEVEFLEKSASSWKYP